jgi:hypothetical protein
MRFRVNFLALILLAAAAQADVIVLKNGRRISAANVVEEEGRVRYETSAGWLSVPKSLVERIERSDYTEPSSARYAEPPVAPPQVVLPANLQEVAREVLVGGSVDRDAIARFEAEARAGSAGAVERVVAAHHVAAQFESEHGRAEAAIGHYRRALHFAPEHLGALLNAAYLHLRRSEYTPALDFLERGRRAAPESADVAKLTGWAYYGQNRLELAVREWRRALELRPDRDTERALEKALRDESEESGYREGESRHFTLRYNGEAAPALAREILVVLEQHFQALEAELNFTPRESIGVILYTNQAFADITRAPGWVGAVNDGRIRVPVQGLSSVTEDLRRILKHELAHSFINQKTRGRCPVWLNEGIAQWTEGMRAGDSAHVFIRAYEGRRALPLDSLEGSFMNLSSNAAEVAYGWSLAVVEYIVRTYGASDIERILDRLSTEGSPEAAVRSVMRMDYAELEQETVKYLKRTYSR